MIATALFLMFCAGFFFGVAGAWVDPPGKDSRVALQMLIPVGMLGFGAIWVAAWA